MEKLGIEPRLLLAQIINFAIIVVVLSKLLYKPILGMLAKRKREIEEGLRLTEKLRVEEEKLGEKKEKVLEKARAEGLTIVEEARKQAKDEAAEIVTAARREADAIVAKGKTDVISLRDVMEKDMQKASVELAVLMAKRLLSSVLTAQDQHRLLGKHMKELEKLHS